MKTKSKKKSTKSSKKKDKYGWTEDDYRDNGTLPKNHPLNNGYSGPD